jgi:UDP-N-acetylmuramoylalanine--D-glutamate ligase
VTLEVEGMRATVVGLAGSGLAATRALTGHGARVLVTEARPDRDVGGAIAQAEAMGAEVRAGGHRPEHLDGADLVVTSPGVPEHADVLRWAADRGMPVWSELEVGARLADGPYAAITGTNGKSTTTEMLAGAMRHAGLDAIACGNVGYPFSAAAAEARAALAVEASSFQLRFHHTFRPRVSALLNVAADHLDWHGSASAYAAAKARIFELQSGDQVHVGNRDDLTAADLSRSAPCSVVWFTRGPPAEGEVGFEGRELVSRLDGERRLGVPAVEAPAHRANAAAAAAAGLAFGLSPDAVAFVVATFRPLPHRGEVVAEVDGVRFVDDSKATNPHAALATLQGFDRAVVICGGRSKGIDLSPLAQAISVLAGAVLIGEAADELAAVFGDRVAVRRSSSIEDAVIEAHALAAGEGIPVVLAPACSSWDMFADYRERGLRFAAAARALRDRRREAV